jgi:hypothetical protein
MTSLDLAHELGFVWVVRMSDGHVGQLDSPEPDMSTLGPNSPSFQDVFAGPADSNDVDPWIQPPLGEPIVEIRQGFNSGAGQERLLAGLEPSPALRRVSVHRLAISNRPLSSIVLILDFVTLQIREAQAERRRNPLPSQHDPADDVEPFTFFGVTQADRKRPVIGGEVEPLSGLVQPKSLPSLAARIVRNAARITLACGAMELDEASAILQDEQVRGRLNALVRRSYQGRNYEMIEEVSSTSAEQQVRIILCNSDHLVSRTHARLVSYDEPPWKISLCLGKEAQRELVCGAMLEPRGLESGFEDPVRRYYLAWSIDIQPVLDRLDKVLVDIYGVGSSDAVVERLHCEQAESLELLCRGQDRDRPRKAPLLGRLLDTCRMWNDTIAGYKVQKLLFAEGVETC